MTQQTKNVGIVGLGDMGSGMAKNLIAAGFPLVGFDLREARLEALERIGGRRAASCAEVAAASDVVFVMVLNGSQACEVVLGPDGLLPALNAGDTVIVTATIMPSEVTPIEQPLAEKGVRLIDCPVSGGKSGADGGALTLMAAAPAETLDVQRDVLEAISKTILHVGDRIGQGQTVKAALQAFIGCTFAATFESLVLGHKAGLKGETLFNVIRASAAGSPLFENCARMILDRRFKDTGSQISTMHKDLGISMSMAREAGAAMFTTGAASELFQAGISMFPDEDNWSVVKVLERIANTEVTW